MVKYARCNAMLSLALDENGQPCRYMSQAETEDAIVVDMSAHLKGVHELDPTDLVNNIKGITKTTRK